MGLIKTFKEDMKNFWKWMPNEVRIYEDESLTRIEIDNPPNPYVPQTCRYFRDKRRGVLALHTKRIKNDKIGFKYPLLK